MSRLKLYAHTRLPARAVSWLQSTKRRSYKVDPCIPAAHSRFMLLNELSRPNVVRMREGIQFYTHAESFESFQWFCWRSPEMVREYDQFVSDCVEKSVFLDVGACHGVYTLTFLSLNPRGRVIAVEPSPAAREILDFNIAKNRVSDRTEVISGAAGVDGGTMYAMPNWHHLEAKSESKDAVSVCTRSIDAICGEYSCIPDTMKVDVEGFEVYVLQGASRILSARPLVYLEIHPQLTAQLGYDHTKCFDLMSEAGYDVTEVGGRPLTRGQFRQRHHTFFTVCRWVRPKAN